MTLHNVTWDQAAILRLATAKAFRAVGINPSTVRKWASDGHYEAVAKAPGGAHLYDIAEVSAVADRPKRKPGRHTQPATCLPDAG